MNTDVISWMAWTWPTAGFAVLLGAFGFSMVCAIAVHLGAGAGGILLALVAKCGRTLSREYLLDATKRGDGDVFDRSIDVLLSRVRRKLGDNEFQLIKTVRNGGYVFTAHVEKIGAGE